MLDIPLLPVIVTGRPLADEIGITYQQLPDGTDPGALRLALARDVRPGDWYLGDCEQPTGRGMSWGTHTYGTYEAQPVVSPDGTSVAMDGEHFHWFADELVMILPREAVSGRLPAAH